jgi:hypothetical protein
MSIIARILKKWLPLAVVTAGLCALVYAAVQQSLRSGANDPQIQLAEDTASALDAGAQAASVVPPGRVELAASLAPFIFVFDDSGHMLASSAVLHGAAPDFPTGVLDYTRANGEDRVTWQPEPGVRMATVAVRFNQGVVVAGRSLREVELRVDNLLTLCGLAMLVLWTVTLALVVLGEILLPGKDA